MIATSGIFKGLSPVVAATSLAIVARSMGRPMAWTARGSRALDGGPGTVLPGRTFPNSEIRSPGATPRPRSRRPKP